MESRSRQAWKGKSPRYRRDLVRGRRGAGGSQDGMDLPAPIGWQLERKQRERRGERGQRELVRPEQERGGGRREEVGERVGEGSGRKGTRDLGEGLETGAPFLCHTRWPLTPTGRAPPAASDMPLLLPARFSPPCIHPNFQPIDSGSPWPWRRSRAPHFCRSREKEYCLVEPQGARLEGWL